MNRKPESLLPSENWEDITTQKLIDAADKVAWISVLDAKFLCEVQRIAPYKGVLCIFDLTQERKCVYEKEVGLAYDALFGADLFDVEMWQEDIIQFIDNT